MGYGKCIGLSAYLMLALPCAWINAKSSDFCVDVPCWKREPTLSCPKWPEVRNNLREKHVSSLIPKNSLSRRNRPASSAGTDLGSRLSTKMCLQPLDIEMRDPKKHRISCAQREQEEGRKDNTRLNQLGTWSKWLGHLYENSGIAETLTGTQTFHVRDLTTNNGNKIWVSQRETWIRSSRSLQNQ